MYDSTHLEAIAMNGYFMNSNDELKRVETHEEEPVALRSHWTDALSFRQWSDRSGKVRTAALLWALGVPFPIVLLVFLFRGCEL